VSNVKLIWNTPDIDKMLAFIARVSNPANQEHHESAPKLIRYMLRNHHVSPFEMANVCIEVTCPRDIARQILRHRSFSFQEFSQRYQKVEQLPPADLREARLQDDKNRQNSIETDDENLQYKWEGEQQAVLAMAEQAYRWALENGIAKEVARAVLPEGLTTTRMYINGNMRSWIFYLTQRLDPSTQKEHRDIAQQVFEVLTQLAPDTMEAAFKED
jgi:thymidylate synthase (FAD)